MVFDGRSTNSGRAVVIKTQQRTLKKERMMIKKVQESNK